MLSKHPYSRIAVALMICLVSTVAGAQTSDTVEPITVSDLDAILQEEILLKAMASRAKQRAELGRYASEAQSVSASNGLPQLSWRRSTASGWLAKFVLSDGASIIAGEGEPLPGGYTVARIDQEGVELMQDGERIELSAAASAPDPAPANAMTAPLSPFPTMPSPR